MANEIVLAMYRPFAATSRQLMLDVIRSHNATLRVEELMEKISLLTTPTTQKAGLS